MSLRRSLPASVLMAALALSACHRSGDTTAPTPINDADRSNIPQGREQPPPGPPPPPPVSTACEPGKAHFAVDQRASDELLERARVAAGASTARFIRPNQAVTTEYLGSRLNLGLDAKDIVRVVSCG